MAVQRTIYYQIVYDKKSKIYTGFCPSMKPVRFSSKSQDEVKDLVSDGIDLFLEKHPKFFDNFEEVKK